MKRSITDKQKEAPRLKYGLNHSTEEEKSGLVERTTERDISFASGKLKEIQFGHFHIGYCELHLKNGGEIPVCVETSSIEMEFVLQGNCRRSYPDYSEALVLYQNKHNLSFVAPTTTSSKWKSEDHKVKLLQVNIEPDYFLAYLKKDINAFKKLEKLKQSI